MNQLVYIDSGRPVTDSLTVADTFGKEHKNVLRDIANLECSIEFSRLNFEHTLYVHPQNGQQYPKYLMTQDGFTFLVMGYTGKEAARFKEMYIKQFNLMRQQIQQPVALDTPQAIAIALQQTADMMLKLPAIEDRIEQIDKKIETRITLTQGEQRRVQKEVATRIYDFSGNQDERRPLFGELYREIKDRWGVPSYRDILSKDMLDVLKYIDAWHPKQTA